MLSLQNGAIVKIPFYLKGMPFLIIAYYFCFHGKEDFWLATVVLGTYQCYTISRQSLVRKCTHWLHLWLALWFLIQLIAYKLIYNQLIEAMYASARFYYVVRLSVQVVAILVWHTSQIYMYSYALMMDSK